MKIIMTITTIAISFLGLTSQLQAAISNCSTQVYSSPEYVSGNCSGNYCTATVFQSRIWANGYCDNGTTFSADSQAPILFLSGQCVNGQINIYKNADYYHWSGRCSNGGSFTAFPTYIPPEYLSGRCTENGTMSLYIPADFIRVDGRCAE